MKKEDQGESYINQFPQLKKWINECICCHKKGYKPNMPDKIFANDFSLEVYFIKKYYKPLVLNEEGLCEVCSKIR